MANEAVQLEERFSSSRLDEIRARMGLRQPVALGDNRTKRAAVAMILRDVSEAPEVLLIRRATRSGDPWSGHMALPGGRSQADDPHLLATAVRETREEVGLDLDTQGRVIAPLDDLVAVARDNPFDLVISPFVCELQEPASLTLNPLEVETAVWVPLDYLASPAARGVHRRELAGMQSEFPALQYREFTIWGLTHRILHGFFEILGR